MDTTDKVLSQAEIDSMFSTSTGGSGGPPAGAPEQPLEPHPEPPIREADTGALTLDSVGKRLEKLEETMFKLGRQDGTPADIFATVKQVQLDIQTLVGHLQAMNTKIETVVTGLGGTVGYAAHENFQCKECENKGMVAAELSCTSCGTKSWWGWFPPKE